MKQTIQASYSRIGDFHVTVKSAVYPPFVESKYVLFSFQDQIGIWTSEKVLETASVCVQNKESKFIVSKPVQFGSLKKMKVRFSSDSSSEQMWFIDLVTVDSVARTEVENNPGIHFPLRRWLTSSRTNIFHTDDCILPQFDEHKTQRQQELEDFQQLYANSSENPGQPLMLDQIPSEDDYDYMPQRADLVKLKTKLKRLAMVTHVMTSKFKTLDDIKKLYAKDFPLPQVSNYWKSDLWFGKMRLQGANPVLLKLCHEIPENFGVKEQDISLFLEGSTLADCIGRKKIFITNLSMLKDINFEDGDETRKMWAPMALFYLNKSRQLMPIAIQLYQERRNDNPVFLPSDHPNTWLLAKIYYNSAEAIHHECFTHLGSIHILLDVAWINTRKSLSPSHPIYKLMAPHFFRLLGNNFYGIAALFRPGGIMDEIFQGKSKMAKDCLQTEFTYKEMNPKVDIEEREVSEWNVLPDYPYRDDMTLFFDVIRRYVSTVVSKYYDTPEKLQNDTEIQSWRKSLGRSQLNGGCGIKDLPGCDTNGLKTNDELIDIITTLISISSIKHAAVNYCQYEMFAFTPNSPLSMRKLPPKTKIPVTESEILKCLPNKKTMLMSMVFLTVLSYLDGNPLGDFDYQYLYHPDDIKARKIFARNLDQITEEIKIRNEKRTPSYEWLLLDYVRNSANM